MKPKYSTRTEKNVQILEPYGRFDAHSVPVVQEWIESCHAAGHYRLLINLEKVSFVDTRALSVMVTGMKRCRQAGGDLSLCHLQKPVRIIFEMTRLIEAFHIFDSQAEALASFLEMTPDIGG